MGAKLNAISVLRARMQNMRPMKDWRQSQKKSVGRGWAKAKATTAAKFSRRFNAMQNVSIMRTNAARGQCEAALIMLGVSGWQRS